MTLNISILGIIQSLELLCIAYKRIILDQTKKYLMQYIQEEREIRLEAIVHTVYAKKLSQGTVDARV